MCDRIELFMSLSSSAAQDLGHAEAKQWGFFKPKIMFHATVDLCRAGQCHQTSSLLAADREFSQNKCALDVALSAREGKEEENLLDFVYTTQFSHSSFCFFLVSFFFPPDRLTDFAFNLLLLSRAQLAFLCCLPA